MVNWVNFAIPFRYCDKLTFCNAKNSYNTMNKLTEIYNIKLYE